MKKPSFNNQVYAVVRAIPKGKVTSYGRIANMIGRGNGRSVGWALNQLGNKRQDPTFMDVPWQRVINSVGKISIKSFEIGKNAQAIELEDDGVEVSEDLQIDLEKYLWEGLLPHEMDEILKDSYS
jgi:methylated-DNA-protein-cysteine methyltransferase related protein